MVAGVAANAACLNSTDLRFPRVAMIGPFLPRRLADSTLGIKAFSRNRPKKQTVLHCLLLHAQDNVLKSQNIRSPGSRGFLVRSHERIPILNRGFETVPKWNDALALPVGEHDVGDPIFKDDALVGVAAFEFEAHAEPGVAVDDFCPGVKCALVADDFDDDCGADSKWGQGINVATADADLGCSGDQLGPSTDFEDLN
jgi:hypothetical protein